FPELVHSLLYIVFVGAFFIGAIGMGYVYDKILGYFDYDKLHTDTIAFLDDLGARRKHLKELYEKLSLATEVDRATMGIDPEYVVYTKDYISTFSESSRQYQTLLQRLPKYRAYSYIFEDSRAFRGLMDNLIGQERYGLITLIQDFTKTVQDWTILHQSELQKIEKQIQSQEIVTENEGGKAALELSRISLQEHLKQLEKVRM
ncbi:MAG: hypothetical protein WC774_05840, partial [Candidatus Gracilibacteria bacterium]